MTRIGIVGMGGMGWFHASRYFQIPGAQLAAIADIRPDRLEARNAVQINIENKAPLPDLSQVQRFPDAASLISEADVDLVDICLPSYLHAEFAVSALQSGHHVLCEKPMALHIQDADRHDRRRSESAPQADDCPVHSLLARIPVLKANYS